MEKVFITKYALTKGILEKEVKIQDHGNGYIRAYEKGGFPILAIFVYHFERIHIEKVYK